MIYTQAQNTETMETINLFKARHAAGGFVLLITVEKGNTRYGESKKKAIIEAIKHPYTEGVYQISGNIVKRQLLNGDCEFLKFDREENEYYFS